MIYWRNKVSVCLVVLLLAGVFNVQSKDDDEKSKKESVGTVIGIDLGTTYSWSVLFLVKLLSLSFDVRKCSCRDFIMNM